jgi:hypothetical protein
MKMFERTKYIESIVLYIQIVLINYLKVNDFRYVISKNFYFSYNICICVYLKFIEYSRDIWCHIYGLIDFTLFILFQSK